MRVSVIEKQLCGDCLTSESFSFAARDPQSVVVNSTLFYYVELFVRVVMMID